MSPRRPGLLVLIGSAWLGACYAQNPAVVEAQALILKEDFSAAAARLAAPVTARDPDALMLQGVLHDSGAGASYDHPLATEYWREAACAGQKDAARLLLPWLNNAYAREWWQERMAGLPARAVQAPRNLVQKERGGLVVDRDRAKKWIVREAQAGNPVGLYNSYHAARQPFGLNAASKARIRSLLERAAEMKLTVAMRELSSELEQHFPEPESMSLGFAKDLPRAGELMRQAADLGDSHAQLLWGHWLNSKKTEPRDPVGAADYYRRSAEQGGAYAAYFLWEAYTDGKGVQADAGKAAEFLRLAAQGGCDSAVRLYATHLFRGTGMAADQKAAIALLEPSLACSLVPNDDALALVAYAYASGSGVPQDITKALWWGRWAAEKGSAYAADLVAKLTAAAAAAKPDAAPR